MGPWGGLLRFFAKEAGHKMGGVVAKDVNAAQKVIRWSHADKIAELKTDTGLSPTYVKELIENSDSVNDLTKITNYLGKKANGYDAQTMQTFYEKLLRRINDVEDKRALQEMIRAFREKSLTMIDHLDHFI